MPAQGTLAPSRNHASPADPDRRPAARRGHFGCGGCASCSIECVAGPGTRPLHRFSGRAIHAARPLRVAAGDRAEHRAGLQCPQATSGEIAIGKTQELLKRAGRIGQGARARPIMGAAEGLLRSPAVCYRPLRSSGLSGGLSACRKGRCLCVSGRPSWSAGHEPKNRSRMHDWRTDGRTFAAGLVT
jgi:hypothetical protein